MVAAFFLVTCSPYPQPSLTGSTPFMMESCKIRRRGRLSSSMAAAASWSVLSALLLSLVVLDVSLPSVSLSFLSLGVAGSDLRLPLVVKLVFQGEKLGGTAWGRV